METWRRQSCLRLQRSRSKLSLMGRLAAASPSAGRQDCLRHEKDGGDRFQVAVVLPSLPKLGRLFLHRVVKLFMGVHHILMCLLNGIELRLLIRMHRILMNGADLRLGCIKDRLNLGLLIRCQIQLIRQMPKAERVTVRTPSSSRTRLCVHNDKSAKCDRTGGHNC